jgi:hypothetical protein
MVRASNDVDIYNVSIHGWANNEYRTTSAYLQLFIMPYLLKFLFKATYKTDTRLQKTTYHAFIQGSSWHWLLQGRQVHSISKHLWE